MHRKIAALMVVLCCGALFAGCAKKEMVRGEESSLSSATPLPQTSPSAEATAPAAQPLQEQPIQQEPVTDATALNEQALNEQPVENRAVEVTLETIYFDFDSFTLSQAARDALARNAQFLIKNPSVRIQVEGHCDERGSDEYNLALGEKRAVTVMNYLETLGVPAGRMSTISYGKEKPAVMGHDDAAWAKNRRVSFVSQ